jgi:hypothetical protein
MGRGTELGKNRKVVTERAQMGISRDKMRKDERKSCWGNNNRGKIGALKKSDKKREKRKDVWKETYL